MIGLPCASLPFSRCSDCRNSACARCAEWSSVAFDSRRLASTMPAVSGGSPIMRFGMEAMGRDSGAAVSSCILDAESRLTPSGLLVLVLDLLRVFVTLSRSTPSVGGGAASIAKVGKRDWSPSLWLSPDGSGVGTPVVGLDTARSRGTFVSAACLGGGSLGVKIGEGRCVVVFWEPFLLLLLFFVLWVSFSSSTLEVSDGSWAFGGDDGSSMLLGCVLGRLVTKIVARRPS